MKTARSLAGLMKFLSRDEWQRALDEMLELHLAPACANADMAIEELADAIGDQDSSVLWGCAFEDLLAHNLDDGRNLVDDYLKRRGWKESAANKAYMIGLRSPL